MGDFTGALRYAIRQLRLAPVFTATVVLTLALGIGGTTAIFTLIDAVMLRSLPVADPGRLYRVGDGTNCCVQGGPQDRWGIFSYPFYERLRSETPEFEELTAFQAAGPRLGVRRERVESVARPMRTEFVAGNYFSTLGIKAFGGRMMTPEDDKDGSPPVIVLSHHVWQGAFGGDPSVVGASFVVNGHPFTAIGIAAPDFFGETLRGDPPDVWIPLHQEPLIAGETSLLRQPISAWLRVIGRLKPGASVDGMSARLTGVLRQWLQYEAGFPANWMPGVIDGLPRQTIAVVPAGAGVGIMKEQYGRSLQLLLGVCALVLLIACANVANLLLTRSVARRQQTAVRLALGASRTQIVKQALLESVVLSIAGGLFGLLIAAGTARLLLSLAFANTQFLPISVRPSWLVLGASFLLALATGLVFGAAPAWFATHTNPVEALRGAGRTTGDRSSTTRTLLLVVQATLSIVLVAGATMLARSLNNLEGQDFGYQVDGRTLVALNRPPATYSPAQLATLYREVDARLRRIPGVQDAGLALYNPLTDNWGELVLVAGHPPPSINDQAGSSWDRVSAGYLELFGIPTLRGRSITAADNETSAPVAVVNESFVRRFFKNDEDPLGQHFGLDLPENVGTFTIVGVVRDAKFAGFSLRQAARPMFYVPLAQTVDYPSDLMRRIEMASHFVSGIALRSDLPAGTLEPLVVRALAEVDPNLTVISIRSMAQQVALSFNQERSVATLAGLFGIVALLLAAVGLYGVTAYGVAQRTNEIGVRVALGAQRGGVIQLIMRHAFVRVVLGLALGIPLAVGAGRLLGTQLYEVTFWDPIALSSAAGALAVCGFLAALIPSLRAASISPLRALRSE